MVEAELERMVTEAIEASREEIYAALQELVRIPSVVGNEGNAQQHIAKLYKGLQLQVDIVEAKLEEIKDHPLYLPLPGSYENRPNVVGTYRGKGGGKSLALNGHIDTVSPDPVEAWTHEPYSGAIEDGKLYGRGAADMKAGLIANYFALKTLLDLGIEPKGDVQLQSVIEEEAGGSGGLLALLLKGYKTDAMLISEPFPDLVVAGAGTCFFSVKVKGKAVHGGEAHLGVNPIGKMMKIYDALVNLEKERAETVHYQLFKNWTGQAAELCLGSLQAGDWPSKVPETAELQGRISLVPGEKIAVIRQLIVDTVELACKGDPWMDAHPPAVEFFGWQTEAWEQDINHPFVKMVKNTAEEISGKELIFAGFPAGLDGRFCIEFGIPCVNFGPKGLLHQVDEYVVLDEVIGITKIYALMIMKWCGYDYHRI